MESPPATSVPDKDLVTWAHVIYALHAVTVLIAITSAATIVGAFVFGVPSIVAVILNYIKRSDATGTFLESHFRWQIRTFWFAALWCAVAFLLFITLVGIPLAWLTVVVVGIWIAYRVARGWLVLKEGKPLVF